MKKVWLFVTAVFVFTLLSLGVLHLKVLSYINAPYQSQPPGETTYKAPELPQIQRLTNPRAILVMDVSGSMSENDPDHVQTQAASLFYNIYSDLAQEILDTGETAQIAVVLFSSISQIVDWEGNNNPWLVVDSRNKALFIKAVKKFLGQKGSEPRKGQDTDYLSALEELEKLTNGLNTPPAIIFMTDGQYEPHPLFSTTNSIQLLSQQLSPVQNTVLENVRSGDFRYINPELEQGVFNRNRIEFAHEIITFPRMRFDEADLLSYKEKVRQKVATLVRQNRFALDGRTGTLPMVWTPLFLGEDEKKLDVVRDVLINTNEKSRQVWHSPEFVHCKSAEDMAGEFVAVLARWMQLHAVPIDLNLSEFQIPKGVQAFAVVLESRKPQNSFSLRQDAKTLNLNGQGTVWAGVGKGEGTWIYNDSSLARGMIYLRPRYQWVLHIPKTMSVKGDGKDNLEIKIYLYSLENGGPVPVETVLENIPEGLSATIELPNADTKRILLEKPDNISSADPMVFQGQLDLSTSDLGQISVSVDMYPLKKIGVPLWVDSLKETVDLQASIQFVLEDHLGRKTGALEVRGIPSTRELLQRILGD